ncbi:uncharacterized protein CG13380-like [Drosophila sulfurigaster albostrigata]|uniref:uncharacterized protein CG13380-like n=1 Tax=Drosophila sulfurigaster albostrigata TaxID=89887 RepID=UPI002D21D7F7|nr:uncharacterized protein CG13380-like [Drosophila sulfurigaster albostrigata]
MEIQQDKLKSKYCWAGKTVTAIRPIKSGQENSATGGDCICARKRGLISCVCCQKSFMGRIASRCPQHPEVAYLMDSRNCAFCGAAAKYLQIDEV